MTSPAETGITCPRCETPVPANAEGWRFCPVCGAPLAGAACARCATPLSPGARFCHRCGAPTGAGAAATGRAPFRTRTAADLLPWIVGGIAVIALFGLLAVRALSRDARSSPAASAAPFPQTGSSFDPSGAPASTDISQLSPEERADRLYNRVMLLAAAGKQDSVAFFAPMAIQAYQMIGPLNEDQHYDVGRIATIAGDVQLAKVHADAILARSPNHLLGLILAAHVAELEGDAAAAARYRQRLLSVEREETARALPEYDRHREEIVAALAAARGSRR